MSSVLVNLFLSQNIYFRNKIYWQLHFLFLFLNILDSIENMHVSLLLLLCVWDDVLDPNSKYIKITIDFKKSKISAIFKHNTSF